MHHSKLHCVKDHICDYNAYSNILYFTRCSTVKLAIIAEVHGGFPHLRLGAAASFKVCPSSPFLIIHITHLMLLCDSAPLSNLLLIFLWHCHHINFSCILFALQTSSHELLYIRKWSLCNKRAALSRNSLILHRFN
jgi:hypothetical protein